jgi:hypothetical protein
MTQIFAFHAHAFSHVVTHFLLCLHSLRRMIGAPQVGRVTSGSLRQTVCLVDTDEVAMA